MADQRIVGATRPPRPPDMSQEDGMVPGNGAVGDLVAGVGEEAGRADAGDAGREPGPGTLLGARHEASLARLDAVARDRMAGRGRTPQGSTHVPYT